MMNSGKSLMLQGEDDQDDSTKVSQALALHLVGYKIFRTALARDSGNELRKGNNALPPCLCADKWTDAIWSQEESGQVRPV
jgi:hypothetical protein